MPLKVKKVAEGIQFSATLQPRSSKNLLVGVYNDTLKIKLTSPPVEGAANKMCVKFLAKVLGVSPSRISIVQGQTSKHKTIQIDSMDEKEFLQTIQPALSPAAEGDKNTHA